MCEVSVLCCSVDVGRRVMVEGVTLIIRLRFGGVETCLDMPKSVQKRWFIICQMGLLCHASAQVQNIAEHNSSGFRKAQLLCWLSTVALYQGQDESAPDPVGTDYCDEPTLCCLLLMWRCLGLLSFIWQTSDAYWATQDEIWHSIGLLSVSLI